MEKPELNSSLKTKVAIYSGQALALVLIVLIVGGIIAMAIISRSQKSQSRTIDERKSTNAVEVSTSIINLTQKLTLTEIEDALMRSSCAGATPCCIDVASSGLFSADQVPSCSQSSGGEQQTDTKICFDRVNEFSNYQLLKDDVLSIPISWSSASACSLDFNFSAVGTNQAGVVVNKIMANKTAGGAQFGDLTFLYTKGYEGWDYDRYLVAGVSDGTVWSNWGAVQTSMSFPLVSRSFNSTTFQPHELRLTAVGGNINVNMSSTPSGCFSDVIFYKVTASANCGGDYRANWYYKPVVPGASPIFDYAIFNGKSSLTYNEDQ